jgi:hypothetical protein
VHPSSGIEVEDRDSYIAKIKAHGGTIISELGEGALKFRAPDGTVAEIVGPVATRRKRRKSLSDQRASVKRRDFITLLGGVAKSWQKTPSVPRSTLAAAGYSTTLGRSVPSIPLTACNPNRDISVSPSSRHRWG